MARELSGLPNLLRVDLAIEEVFIKKLPTCNGLTRGRDDFRAAPEIHAVFDSDAIDEYHVESEQSCIGRMMFAVDLVVLWIERSLCIVAGVEACGTCGDRHDHLRIIHRLDVRQRRMPQVFAHKECNSA